VELAVTGEPVGCGVFGGPPHQRIAPLDPDHMGAQLGNRQAEVAQTAEQVGDALARLRIEQLHRAAHQQAVDAHIDLGEIGGPEGHRHTELGQRVGKARRIGRMQAPA
jgi:hypothetical protein